MKVSIIIPNHNHSKYLNRSIRSAFVQNFDPEKYEIILVDDSSSDWSKEIIESYGCLITKIYLNENLGLAAARNRGVRVAKAPYVVFVDADDYVHRDLIYIESMFLDLNAEWDAVAVDYQLIDDEEEIIGRVNCELEPIACGIMYRKERLLEIGLFDESFRMHEDKELRARFTSRFTIERIPLPLYRYRQHESNLSSNQLMSDEYLKRLEAKLESLR